MKVCYISGFLKPMISLGEKQMEIEVIHPIALQLAHEKINHYFASDVYIEYV